MTDHYFELCGSTMASCITSSESRWNTFCKENCATKAEFSTVLHSHDCREVTHHHHDYDEHIMIVLIIPYIASPLVSSF